MVVVERCRPLCVVLPPIAPFVSFIPLPLKIAQKGAILPTLRTTGLHLLGFEFPAKTAWQAPVDIVAGKPPGIESVAAYSVYTSAN